MVFELTYQAEYVADGDGSSKPLLFKCTPTIRGDEI